MARASAPARINAAKRSTTPNSKPRKDHDDIDALFNAASNRTKASNTLKSDPVPSKTSKTSKNTKKSTVIAAKSSSDNTESTKPGSITPPTKMAVMAIDLETPPTASKPITIVKDDDDGFADSRGLRNSRKRTEEGFRVFTNEEMRIGEGNGDTPDCPFNCWCCY